MRSSYRRRVTAACQRRGGRCGRSGAAPGLADLPVADVPYAGLGLDRATGRREDPVWVAALAADPRARVAARGATSAWSPGMPAPLCAAARRRRRRRRRGSGGVRAARARRRGPGVRRRPFRSRPGRRAGQHGADAVADIRSLFAGLPPAEAGALAYARGVLRWNRHQRYSAAAAPPPDRATRSLAGLLERGMRPAAVPAHRARGDHACRDGRPAAPLSARAAPCLGAGGYSLLAGFVEIGESLEDAVRREIFEEAGVALRDVRYVGSQPWPFPAGLMVGFRATAADESVSVDGNEIIEARWFTREQVAGVRRDHRPAGPPTRSTGSCSPAGSRSPLTLPVDICR